MSKNKKIQNFRKKLKNSKLIGGWLQLSDPNIARIVSQSKFLDWLCLDLEHGLINLSSISNILDAVEASKKIILARISYSDIKDIPKILDLGIDGIIIANVKNEKDILNIFNISNYPPAGERGLGFSRYNDFKLNKDDLKIKPILIPMVENLTAFKNLKKILSYKKLFDGIFIGPVDFSLSIGDNLKFSKKYKKKISEINKLSRLNKVPMGLHIIKGNKQDIARVFKNGVSFVAYLTDTVVLQNY